jgi:hypothetical protein
VNNKDGCLKPKSKGPVVIGKEVYEDGGNDAMDKCFIQLNLE